jgi:hypothetical protein
MEALNGERQNYHWLDPFAAAFDGSQLLDMLNVRYILVDATIPADRPDVAAIANRFTEAWRNQHVIVYENPNVLPRAWIVHDVTTMTDAEGLAALDRGVIDGRAIAYVDGDPPPTAPATGTESVTVVSQEPERIVIDVTASSDGLVVLADSWDAGWTATVDGDDVGILRTDTTFRGIPVTTGSHTIELRYEPVSLRIGMIGTGIGSAGALAIWAWALVDLRRRRAAT